MFIYICDLPKKIKILSLDSSEAPLLKISISDFNISVYF